MLKYSSVNSNVFYANWYLVPPGTMHHAIPIEYNMKRIELIIHFSARNGIHSLFV